MLAASWWCQCVLIKVTYFKFQEHMKMSIKDYRAHQLAEHLNLICLVVWRVVGLRLIMPIFQGVMDELESGWIPWWCCSGHSILHETVLELCKGVWFSSHRNKATSIPQRWSCEDGEKKKDLGVILLSLWVPITDLRDLILIPLLDEALLIQTPHRWKWQMMLLLTGNINWRCSGPAARLKHLFSWQLERKSNKSYYCSMIKLFYDQTFHDANQKLN